MKNNKNNKKQNKNNSLGNKKSIGCGGCTRTKKNTKKK